MILVLSFTRLTALEITYNNFEISLVVFMRNIGEQGMAQWWERSPPWPAFKSRLRLHMWVEFVVGSLPCSERFLSAYSGFPLSSKTNISKFQFDQESGRRRTTLWMCYLQIFIYLIIYITTNHAITYTNLLSLGKNSVTIKNKDSGFVLSQHFFW